MDVGPLSRQVIKVFLNASRLVSPSLRKSISFFHPPKPAEPRAFLTIGFPYMGALPGFHVPPFKCVDLAACYRPGSSCDREGAKPLPPCPLPIPWIQPFATVSILRSFITGLNVFSISTPSAHQDYGFLKEGPLTISLPTFRCFASLSGSLFIQNRRVV